MERNSNVMKNRLIHSVIRNLTTVGYDLHVHGGRLFAVGYSRRQGSVDNDRYMYIAGKIEEYLELPLEQIYYELESAIREMQMTNTSVSSGWKRTNRGYIVR